MARKRTGSVAEYVGAKGTTYTMRFHYGDERMQETLPLGTSRKEAEAELSFRVEQIARGLWHPDEPITVAKREPRFDEFASEWYFANEREWRPNTQTAYEQQLRCHLLPFFGAHRLSQIDVAAVDAYREFKLREGALAGESINKTITRLGQILDVALERDLILRNPVRIRPKARRVKTAKKSRPALDDAAPIDALLRSAAQLDVAARSDRRHIPRRVLVALLVFGGLRIDEALSLRWRDVDLANGRIRISEAKTDAGIRWAPMLAPLREDLSVLKASRDVTANDFVIPTVSGGKQDACNLRDRIWKGIVDGANALLDDADEAPLPERLTFHGLRHTYISVRVALGHDIATIAYDVGHADPSVTLRIYTHMMRRDPEARERLRVLVEGGVLADNGGNAAPVTSAKASTA